MRKYQIYILIVFLFILVLFLNHNSHQEYSTSYQASSFSIKETFTKEEKVKQYDFLVSNKNEKYYFRISNDHYQKKRLIYKIKKYTEDHISCILPFYLNDFKQELYCLYDNEQVSNDYLRNNENFQAILSKVNKYYTFDKEEEIIPLEYEKLLVYTKNILENDTYYIWNYKGIYILNQDGVQYQKFLDYDLYDNVMAIATKRYYVLFDNTSVSGIKNIYYYDLLKDKVDTFSIKEKISKNSYINGVENELIYITDKRNKKQYSIDIAKKKIVEVGNEVNGFVLYENHKKKLLKTSDFLMENQYFENVKKIYSNITQSSDCVFMDSVYYFVEGNHFYKQREGYPKVLLFDMDDVVEWNVVGEDILLLKDDSLYLYHDEVGLNKILDYLELKYNYQNIYQLGR